MSKNQLPFSAILAGVVALGVLRVSGIEIYTSTEVEAVNGTNARLKCTFQTTAPISPSSVTVSWNFRPQDKGQEESVFYYHEKPYPPTEGRFHKRAEWAGDIQGRDASIIIREVQFSFNGTFSCQVKNRPDVHGVAGEVRLKVVATASYSEIGILAAAIGGSISLVIIIFAVIVCFKRCHKRLQERDQEYPLGERKEHTVCLPAEVLPLNKSEEVEIDSSDGKVSEPSTKDHSSINEGEKGSGGYASSRESEKTNKDTSSVG